MPQSFPRLTPDPTGNRGPGWSGWAWYGDPARAFRGIIASEDVRPYVRRADSVRLAGC